MDILIIEDEQYIHDAIAKKINGLVNITSSYDLESSLNHIENGNYDLIILDLAIPSIIGLLDHDPQHGLQCFYRIKDHAFGTPVIIFTGSTAEDFIDQLLISQDVVNLWGEELSLIRFSKKYNILEGLNLIDSYKRKWLNLNSIEITNVGFDLDWFNKRLFKIFVLNKKGVRGIVEVVGGGLSEAEVYKMAVYNSQGNIIFNVICKIANSKIIAQETNNYNNFICRLPNNASARLIDTIKVGAKNKVGVFYSLAQGFNDHFFSDRVLSDSANVFNALKGFYEGWEVSEKRIQIGDIRKLVLSDKNLEIIIQKYNLDWVSNFEEINVQVNWGCCHGDLHGLNILVKDETAILIDYGDVKEAPSCLDPITLELSLLFHPKGPLLVSNKISDVMIESFFSENLKIEDSYCHDYINECRKWISDKSIGKKEVLSVRYAYLIRQLKYDTNPTVALKLLQNVYKQFMEL
ncbi:response regulator [Acinetobacter seifertii]|uniref:response regulator n=1 Tax=Acinetobacter seifertii TaxID=1530123 RepID=UPI00124D98A0|nr:response regulator [Acinetobacter seifertii]